MMPGSAPLGRSPLAAAGLLAAGLLAAALAAHPCAAQNSAPNCTAITATSPLTTCKIQGVTATFGSAATGTIDVLGTIQLATGWVYIVPPSAVKADSPSVEVLTPPVKVGTTYTNTASPSPVHAAVGRDSIVHTLTDGSSAGVYLVIAQPASTVVALLAGSMIQPATLKPGCALTYEGGGVGGLASFTSTVTSILGGLNVSTSGYSCTTPPCLTVTNATLADCTIQGDTAKFGMNATGSINTGTATITLSSGYVYLVPGSGNGAPAPVSVSTGPQTTVTSNSVSGNPGTFLVIADSTSTTVALVSGRMVSSPGMQPGNFITIASGGSQTPAQSITSTAGSALQPILCNVGASGYC